MADEEPKTPTSASGLYNSSIFNVDAVFSSTILGGLSDFTIMNWFYISPPNPLDFYTQSYVEFGSSVNINPIRVFENKVDVSITNSSGGNIFITYPYTTPVDEWIHIAVTGSVTNNKVTLYINGVEVASTVMIYSIATGSTSGLMSDTSYASRAQLNIYNRELSEAEVAEHYVYDDDTMSSGVLGWDAMTPAQRSGLIYSSSYTDDISISGNEFNDKSGSGITISPQPSLTGQQIYFYTDASDLPSTTTIYDVNSATFNGTSNFMSLSSTAYLAPLTGSVSVSTWVYADRTSYPMFYTYTDGTAARFNINITIENKFEVYLATGVNQERSYKFDYVLPDGWSYVTYNWTRTTANDVGEFYVDGVRIADAGTWIQTSLDWTNVNVSNKTFEIARLNINAGQLYYSQSQAFSAYLVGSTLSQADVTYLYNGGTHLCWDDVQANNPTLYAKIEECFDLATYNGSTELQARTGHKNGWVLDNTSATPFTDQGLQVECTN